MGQIMQNKSVYLQVFNFKPRNYQDARTLFDHNQEAFQNPTICENAQRNMEQLPEDVLATSLISGEFGDEVFALKATHNPGCGPCVLEFRREHFQYKVFEMDLILQALYSTLQVPFTTFYSKGIIYLNHQPADLHLEEEVWF